MSQQDRLPGGGRINRAIVLNFTFNGRQYVRDLGRWVDDGPAAGKQ